LKKLKKKLLKKLISEAKNDKVVKAVEKIKKAGVKILRNDEWQIEDNLVLKERKVYVIILKFLELDKRTTLVLSNTKELDRDPFTN